MVLKTQDLSIRVTNKYVGTYAHLDKWQLIATGQIIGSHEIPQPESDDGAETVEEPNTREVFILITQWAPDLHDRWCHLPLKEDPDIDHHKWVHKQLMQALIDTYTQVGCAHEYDCCGCRSYYGTDPQHVTGDLYKITVSSSRNF